MTANRAAGLLLFSVMLAAQNSDIHERLRQALGPEADAKAEQLLAQRRYLDVEAMLRADQHALRAILQFMAGRMEIAVNEFAEAGQLHEPDRFTLAMALVKLGRDQAAREELTRLEAANPNQALYSYWLGRIDYDQRRYDDAVTKLKRAAELEPKSARTWDSLGLAYDMQGKPPEALAAFEEGARLNRQDARHSPWPPHDLGALLLRMGEPKKAEAAFREALQYDPNMEQAHYHLGRTFEKEGADDQALREYETAFKLDERSSDICYSLAMLYRKLGRAEDARVMFQEWRKRRDAQQ